jgi:hypothetical protein
MSHQAMTAADNRMADAVQKPRSSTAGSLHELQHRLNRLSLCLSELQTRLSPVMYQGPVKSAGGQDPTVPVESLPRGTPLENVLAGLHIQVQNVHAQASDMLLGLTLPSSAEMAELDPANLSNQGPY